MSYSPALTYFLDRLSGYSTNVFRLEPQNEAQEQRRAIAEALRTANAEKSVDSERVQADNTLSQNAS